MKILITNDDGDSEGLRMLLETARKLGDAYAIVPNRQRSAISGAVTLHKPIRLHKIEKDIYSINGTPADCVLFSIYSKEFEKPDLVLSGINWGDNTGIDSLLGSGTLGACWKAAIEGIPAIAFSMHKKNRNWRDKGLWGDGKKIGKIISGIMKKIETKLAPGKFFSVNLPDDLASPKTIFTNQLHYSRFRTRITKKYDPNGEAYFWTSGGAYGDQQGSDYHEVTENKNITISEFSLKCFEKE